METEIDSFTIGTPAKKGSIKVYFNIDNAEEKIQKAKELYYKYVEKDLINKELNRWYKMETKSRYEVISELEEKRRGLISEKQRLQENVRAKEQKIKIHDRNFEDMKRQMEREREDLVSDLENYKETLDQREETIDELIKSVDNSLGKFDVSQSQKKQ